MAAWTRGGFGAAPRALPRTSPLQPCHFYEPVDARHPRRLSLHRRQPVLARSSAPAARLLPPLHLGERAPSPPAPRPGSRPAPASRPLLPSFQVAFLPPRVPRAPCLGRLRSGAGLLPASSALGIILYLFLRIRLCGVLFYMLVKCEHCLFCTVEVLLLSF